MKNLVKIMTAALILSFLCASVSYAEDTGAETDAASGQEINTPAPQYKTYTAGLKKYKKKGKAVKLQKMLPKKYRYKYVVAQGAATDGKYVYQAFEKHFSNKCVILKYNAGTFKKVKVSKPLKIYHANDMTYVPDRKLIYSANCDGKPLEISIINPKTLKKTGTKRVVIPSEVEGASKAKLKKIKQIVSISYDSTAKQFIARPAASIDFLVLDSELRAVRYVTAGKKLKYRPQTLEQEGDYILVPHDKNGKGNFIRVFRKNGQFQYDIKIKNKYEIESLVKAGSTYRVTMYHGRWTIRGFKRDTYVYRIGIKKMK